jgi:hypothetical protein
MRRWGQVRGARNFIFAFCLKKMACGNPTSADSSSGQCVIPTRGATKVDPTEAGSRTRVYEILRRSRPLSLGMIRRLHERLHIPAEVLIRPGRKGRSKQA